MTKISLLPEMLRADVVAGDLLPIVDVSAGATDRIKIGEIFALLPGRNRIINAQGRINQRVYVSGTATVAANQYTLDRWRVVTSGQNLTWTGNAARNVMTAPAGGVEQVIEGLNIEGGTYTINWDGTAACTVAGVARAKGEVFTLTAAADTTVRFTGGTFTDVQLEPGVIPTAFERAYHGDELARCQRYYQLVGSHVGVGGGATAVSQTIALPVTMRGIPAASTNGVLVISDGYTLDFTQSAVNISLLSATNRSAYVTLGSFSGLTTGRLYFSRSSNSNSVVFDAEL